MVPGCMPVVEGVVGLMPVVEGVVDPAAPGVAVCANIIELPRTIVPAAVKYASRFIVHLLLRVL